MKSVYLPSLHFLPLRWDSLESICLINVLFQLLGSVPQSPYDPLATRRTCSTCCDPLASCLWCVHLCHAELSVRRWVKIRAGQAFALKSSGICRLGAEEKNDIMQFSLLYLTKYHQEKSQMLGMFAPSFFLPNFQVMQKYPPSSLQKPLGVFIFVSLL